MMTPEYVECDDYNVVGDRVIGCAGRRIRLREYRLRANPDQRPGNDITHSVIAKWACSGMPHDVVYHLGGFHRVTVGQGV